ncbi:MAG: peptidylprolyl isomerase [Alphaproteobacteria bacterium]|nr:peptidylprolyl isomerase [Alphaproteobacteria bacterium]
MRFVAIAVALAGALAAGTATAQQAPAAPPPQAPATKAPAAQTPAGPAAGQPADPVAARVDGFELRQSDVAAAFARLPPEVQEMPMPLIYPQILQQLAGYRLLTVQGRKAKLQDDAEVKARVARFEDTAIQQRYLEKLVDASVTDALLKKRFAAAMAKRPKEFEVRASHILVETEAAARAVLAELAKGADFAKLARERSIDGSAARGGDLGFFRHEQMAGEFSDAAFAMTDGQVTKETVRSRFGFHIIKMTGKREAAPPTFDEARDELSQQVARELILAEVNKLKGAAKIEMFNIDGTKLDPSQPPPGVPGTPAGPARHGGITPLR